MSKEACICPKCEKSNWNPWTPNQMSPEEAVNVHNNLFHDGEEIAHLTE